MTVLSPWVRAGEILRDTRTLAPLYDSDEWQTFVIVYWGIFAVLSLISFGGGWGLYRKSDWSAVRHAKVILWITGPGGVATSSLAIVILLGSEAVDGSTVIRFVVSTLLASIWTMYLSKSKRVKNTYAETSRRGESASGGARHPNTYKDSNDFYDAVSDERPRVAQEGNDPLVGQLIVGLAVMAVAGVLIYIVLATDRDDGLRIEIPPGAVAMNMPPAAGSNAWFDALPRERQQRLIRTYSRSALPWYRLRTGFSPDMLSDADALKRYRDKNFPLVSDEHLRSIYGQFEQEHFEAIQEKTKFPFARLRLTIDGEDPWAVGDDVLARIFAQDNPGSDPEDKEFLKGVERDQAGVLGFDYQAERK